MICLMGQRLNRRKLVRMDDELFVSQLLDKMEGRPNRDKARSIVKGLRKRWRERHLENERMAAERVAENPAHGDTISPMSGKDNLTT